METSILHLALLELMVMIWLGFKTGNPRVGFCHTVPVPGTGAYRTVILAVWFKTRGTFGTRGYFSLK